MRYGDLEHYKQLRRAPYVKAFVDLELKATQAEAEADPHSARHFRHQARVLKRHIERLDAL